MSDLIRKNRIREAIAGIERNMELWKKAAAESASEELRAQWTGRIAGLQEAIEQIELWTGVGKE